MGCCPCIAKKNIDKGEAGEPAGSNAIKSSGHSKVEESSLIKPQTSVYTEIKDTITQPANPVYIPARKLSKKIQNSNSIKINDKEHSKTKKTNNTNSDKFIKHLAENKKKEEIKKYENNSDDVIEIIN